MRNSNGAWPMLLAIIAVCFLFPTVRAKIQAALVPTPLALDNVIGIWEGHQLGSRLDVAVLRVEADGNAALAWGYPSYFESEAPYSFRNGYLHIDFCLPANKSIKTKLIGIRESSNPLEPMRAEIKYITDMGTIQDATFLLFRINADSGSYYDTLLKLIHSARSRMTESSPELGAK